MAQYVSHLLEGGATCQQSVGHGVAKQVRAGVGQSGMREGLANRFAYQICSDGFAARRVVTHEDRSIAGLGAFLFQVSRDGSTSGCW